MASRIAVMKDGLLQQIDSPQHLYDHPGNVFVAGFIGSPSMNFFDITLVEQDGKLFVDGGTFKLLIPESKKNQYLPHKGQKVIFGIRPEDVFTKQYPAPGIVPADIKADVDVTELNGERNLPLPAVGEEAVHRTRRSAHAHSARRSDRSCDQHGQHATCLIRRQRRRSTLPTR